MAGGFSLLKDVYKTTVYQLANFINKNVHVDLIPANILIKEPSAELAPDQKDTDSLPPYDILDPILEAYIDQHKTMPEIINAGFNKHTVMRVVQLVKRSEHKRRQAPPGLILSSQVLDFQSRLPITNLFTDEDYIRRNNI
jgi:NAD+ synthase (glutamine-hydrolysing)